MPTYQYHCPHCNTEFEEFQKMTDPALEHCPTCNKKPERLISSGGGLIFKGSGFYITDYKKSSKDGESKSKDASGSKSEPSKPASSASESSKTESKPKPDGSGKAPKE